MSDRSAVLGFWWDGEHMIPLNRYAADRAYVVGERYKLSIYEERSTASHRHYFACLSDAFDNLPHHLALRFHNADHLRKFALIKAGYCNEKSIVCDSYEDATRTKGLVEAIDDYAFVVTEGKIVTVYTAKQQTVKAMDKDTFQKSKTAVLEIVAEMIGVTVDELARNAGSAA